MSKITYIPSHGTLNNIQIDSGKVYLDNHMSTEKVALLVKILVDGNQEKLKKIIREDFDQDLVEEILKINNFEFEFYVEIFSYYLKKFDPSKVRNSDLNIFSIIIDKMSNRSELSKLEKLVVSSPFGQKYYGAADALIFSIINKKEKLPSSMDFIVDEK